MRISIIQVRRYREPQCNGCLSPQGRLDEEEVRETDFHSSRESVHGRGVTSAIGNLERVGRGELLGFLEEGKESVPGPC